MANLNRVLLIGRLTRDPELRYTPSGSAVTEFGLAVNRNFKDSSGERREQTCFVDIQAWGRQAEVINEYLRKGRQVFVEGRLDFSSWETPEGQKRSKLRVVVENFQFLGGRDEGGGYAQRGPAHVESGGATQPSSEGGYGAPPQDLDEPKGDVPF